MDLSTADLKGGCVSPDAEVPLWEVMRMIDDLIDMQERGVRDRILGYALHDNPMVKPGTIPPYDADSFAEWYAKFDAWRFGWAIEDADRIGRPVQAGRGSKLS